MQRKPYSPSDFAWTNWHAEEIKERVEAALVTREGDYKKVKKIPAGERTFENTVFGIANAGSAHDEDVYKANILMNASADQIVRDAANAAIEKFSMAAVDIEYDEGLALAIKEYAAKNESITGPDKKLFNDILRRYRRMGFELSAAQQHELKENLRAIAKSSQSFQKNINDYLEAITATREELDGLSENYIAGLTKDKDGNYLVTTAYPEYRPFVREAKNRAKRKELIDKNLQKGGEENITVLKMLIDLRAKNAALLGYKNHADFMTEIRMAKNSATVRAFLLDLGARLKPAVTAIVEKLKTLRHETDPNAPFEFYDLSFSENEYLKKSFHLENERIREYFPLEHVKASIFKIYGTLFSVQFKKLDGYPLWHPDVELYSVTNQDDSLAGYFCLDLFPREKKYSHAGAFEIVTGGAESFEPDAPYRTPFCSIIANFTKPSGELPSLMSHDEVETFFHEFGHVMHFVLGAARYTAQTSFMTATDFVEAPSQIFENWTWDKEMLKLISRHYKIGEPLPDSMTQTMIAAKKFSEPIETMRQVIYALYDLALHTEKNIDLRKCFSDLYLEYMGIPMPEDHNLAAGFGHLVGYDAGYYSYLWSKVYAADMFTRFKKEGLLNPATGGDYRKWILEKGSSMEEIDLVKNFLGREPTNDAFLEEIGAKNEE